MQKRVLTLLAVSLLGLALVSGCGSSEKKEASTPQNKVIRLVRRPVLMPTLCTPSLTKQKSRESMWKS